VCSIMVASQPTPGISNASSGPAFSNQKRRGLPLSHLRNPDGSRIWYGDCTAAIASGAVVGKADSGLGVHRQAGHQDAKGVQAC